MIYCIYLSFVACKALSSCSTTESLGHFAYVYPDFDEREFTCCILTVFCFMRLANAKTVNLFAASRYFCIASVVLADQVYIDSLSRPSPSGHI
ncbi:hypothetical protein PITC_039520 [Penicillium italicum]|uniref:Uncharacterized protein n=1 Tax=Penicillium italicum TaxID=40296 RepID=A0A0A2L3L5_PENIT|nr:hypothetical protein PITC_039520 [Penicillium italicum]